MTPIDRKILSQAVTDVTRYNPWPNRLRGLWWFFLGALMAWLSLGGRL